MIELPGPLVSADWLAAHLDDVQVADVRWYLDGRSGCAIKSRLAAGRPIRGISGGPRGWTIVYG